MLSHLRFHRRGTSNPTSPAPDQASPSSLGGHQSPFASDSLSPYDGQWPSAATSSLPPTLPPIPRVTSSELDLHPDERLELGGPSQPEYRPQQMPRSGSQGDLGFIGGAALRNYRSGGEPQYTGDTINNENQLRPQRSAAPSASYDQGLRPSPQISGSASRSTASFGTRQIASFGASTQSRPINEQPVQSISNHVYNLEPQKGRKGLPFLKNPMSTLLLRRKTNQLPPNIMPLQLNNNIEEPTYDPRIRGTRVHDFSAPRRRANGSVNDTVAIRSASRSNLTSEGGLGLGPVVERRENRTQDSPRRHISSVSDPTRTESVATFSQPIAQSSSISSKGTRSSSIEQTIPPDDHPGPPVPPKDDALILLMQSKLSAASRMHAEEADILSTSTGSAKIARSRNVSLSSIPKHMKSTSSRFSFDMIGAAKQEKLLEERHRQRELDKRAALDEERDSRFDDFDEDAFDYDAMMHDDGLEERIPGVNADYDEEDPYLDDQYLDNGSDSGQYIEDDADPDDDQENFAGFVFQRSNPTSSLTSPKNAGMSATPRDADGKVIGFAMSKDTPGLPNALELLEPNATVPSREAEFPVSGLGIQGMDMAITSETSTSEESLLSSPNSNPQSSLSKGTNTDDLYFDDGVPGHNDMFAEDLAASPEIDGVPFDESIFDNDDTDQFGRPVPGAFALARSTKQTSHHTSFKRESDVMSGASAQSGISESTAHTSLSIDAVHMSKHEIPPSIEASPSATESSIVSPQPTTYSGGAVAAYQAALAAAAQEAAASGKFHWKLPLSQGDSGQNSEASRHNSESKVYSDDSVDDYGYSYDDMDDFEMDDDAIIAEANASALANDSDGWYGQEFGFYAVPINQHGPNNPDSGANAFGYANGGFFGPKGAGGLDRTTSGRVVSREPNLTPITERSEYSNRNSIMSLGMPPISGTPSVQSPGLAQLAMIADRGDDQMSLSALLRLRSRAWGGSQVSLASSKDGSPRSERGDAPSSPRAGSFSGAFPTSNSGHTRKNSVFSIISRESDTGSAPGSPTLPFAIAGTNRNSAESWSNPIRVGTSSSNDLQNMPVASGSGTTLNEASASQETSSQTATYQRTNKGHQRQKGSSDSISYMKEEESGETRWVMERRRTGESGQVEILEREVVEGGRI